jgi:hypothetical protein
MRVTTKTPRTMNTMEEAWMADQRADQLADQRADQRADQPTAYEHRETLRRTRVIFFFVGVVVAIAPILGGRSLFESSLHVSDDYHRGTTFTDTGACERMAETVYQHDLFGSGPYDSDGYATRAQKAFYAGCTRQVFPHD